MDSLKHIVILNAYIFLMVHLTGEESNRLFEILQDWESQLAHYDLDDLRCDNDNFSP